MKRRVIIFLAAAMAFVGVTLAQNVRNEADRSGDPWWRPFNPQGQSYGVSYGLTRPTRAQGLFNGEIFVDLDGDADSGPLVEIYDATNATWDTVGGITLSSLTANTLIKVNSAGTAIVDSNITDDATTITIGGTTLTTAVTTFNATATTVDFTTAGLALTTGGVLTADADFDIQAVGLTHISADGSSTADALAFGTSQTADAQIYWDGGALVFDVDGTASNDILFDMAMDSGARFRVHVDEPSENHFEWNAINAASTGYNAFEIRVEDLADLDTATANLLHLNLTESNPSTGAATFNILNIQAFTSDSDMAAYRGINIQGITPSATTEVGVLVGAGWDVGLHLQDGSATDDNITLGASLTADAQIYFSGSALVHNVQGTSTNDLILDMGAAGSQFIIRDDLVSGNQFTVDMANATGAAFNFTTARIDAILELSSDTVQLLSLDLNDSEFDTASGSTFNFMGIEAFTPDSDVDYNGINIAGITGAAGTETAINIGAGWDTGLSILADGSSTDDNITLGADRTADAQLYFDGSNFVIDVNGSLNQNVRMAGPVEFDVYRQDFDGPCWRGAVADHTIEDVADGSINAAVCDGGITNFTYRLELAQASPFLTSVTGQGLDIDNDGADNSGVEIILAASQDGTTDSGWYIRGQSPAMYARFNVSIASVSGTDDFVVGWRLSEAFDAAATSTNYDTWAVHRITNNAGNLQIATDVNGAADGADENAVNPAWTDTETITLEVQLSTACVATFYTDGTVNAVTEANDACEVGDIMMPFIMQRNTSDVNAETVINWIEVGEVI